MVVCLFAIVWPGFLCSSYHVFVVWGCVAQKRCAIPTSFCKGQLPATSCLVLEMLFNPPPPVQVVLFQVCVWLTWLPSSYGMSVDC